MDDNMTTSLGAWCAIGLFACFLAACADPIEKPFSLQPATAFPKNYSLPDPFVMLGGRRVTSREQWHKERRSELKTLFQQYMYGSLPPKPVRQRATIAAEYPDFLAGKATLKLIRIDMGEAGSPQIDLMLVLPNQRTTPAPVFLAMNFAGNQSLTADPRVPLARGWVYKDGKGVTNHLCTEASRNADVNHWPRHEWPLTEIIGRGYALATFYSGDIDSDRAEVSNGVYAWLANGDPARNNPTNRGSIAAWAWGFHRCVDYLISDRDINAQRIAVLGHSRQGKAALLAGAFDERIALVVPHQAGCGGTAPSRGKVGESVKRINTSFPHWFNAAFKQFNDEPERLPFDQNCLVALCAPRPVLFSNATEDQWANPTGQFEVLRAADPVYGFLGVEGLNAAEMPPPGHLVDSRLGYYIRDGMHSMTTGDWVIFLNFADRHLGRAPR